jgi:hypothetical protein
MFRAISCLFSGGQIVLIQHLSPHCYVHLHNDGYFCCKNTININNGTQIKKTVVQQNSFEPAPIRPHRCQIIQQSPYWLTFLKVIYCSYILAAQWIRGVFNLYILWVSTTNAEEPEESETGVPVAKEVEGKRQRVRRYHNGRCKDSKRPYSHLLRLTIPDAVLIQFDLLRMSKILLETCTCRGL